MPIMHVLIPTSLRQHTGGQPLVTVDGETVAIAMDDLVQKHPALKSQLFDDAGELVSFVNVFVNDQNIRDLDRGATALREQDEILLVPAIAGG